MLVSATEMINKAHEGHYAIGAFNINNLEWTKAILAAAEDVTHTSQSVFNLAVVFIYATTV